MISCISYKIYVQFRPIHRPHFVLGRKRPIIQVALVELPPFIAIIMHGNEAQQSSMGYSEKLLEYNHNKLKLLSL